jgi:hypothetical protein
MKARNVYFLILFSFMGVAHAEQPSPVPVAPPIPSPLPVRDACDFRSKPTVSTLTLNFMPHYWSERNQRWLRALNTTTKGTVNVRLEWTGRNTTRRCISYHTVTVRPHANAGAPTLRIGTSSFHVRGAFFDSPEVVIAVDTAGTLRMAFQDDPHHPVPALFHFANAAHANGYIESWTARRTLRGTALTSIGPQQLFDIYDNEGLRLPRRR